MTTNNIPHGAQNAHPPQSKSEEYVEHGGIDRALERHANHVFASFTDEQQELAKGIFSKLITVSEGRVDTRRTAVLQELKPANADVEAVAAVVGKLSAEGVRLVITSGVDSDEDLSGNLASTKTTVTIAHEKLGFSLEFLITFAGQISKCATQRMRFASPTSYRIIIQYSIK